MERVTKWTGGVQDDVNYFIHSKEKNEFLPNLVDAVNVT